MALTPGTKLGQYEVRELVGRGGMGEVYKGYDPKLKRDAALKVLPEEFARDQERLSRFRREAQLLASLNHTNIATIYGIHEEPGQPVCLAMEYVPGETLAELIRDSRLGTRHSSFAHGPERESKGDSGGGIPLDETLRITTQICDALEHAHEKPIIHRDLKPANVKLTPEGKVKVLDFGLAKAFAGDSTAGDSPKPVFDSNSPTLSKLPDGYHAPEFSPTLAGVILGTAAYMSPEQAKGKTVDKRTDIWALGAVLYELLTAKRAFDGETVPEILGSIFRAEPDWSLLPASTPHGIRVLLRRCLQKDARERFRDAADVRITIQEALATPITPQSTAVPKRSKLRERVLAGVAAALLIALLGMLAVRRGENGAETGAGVSLRFALPPPENTDFLSGTSSPFPALSPDGRSLALVAMSRPSGAAGGTVTAGVTGIWIHSFDSLSARMLPGTEGAGILTTPFWSPDGRSVGFFADGKLKKSDIAGGPPLVLCDAPVSLAAGGGTWNQDGVILFGAPGRILQVSASGGEPKPVTKVNEARGETAHGGPYFLPDGRHFLYVVRSGKPEVEGVYVGQVDSPGASGAGGESERLVATHNKAEYAAGHLLFLRGRMLLAQPFDAASLKLSGEPVPVADQVGTGTTTGRAAYSVAANGTLVFGPGGAGLSTRLRWFDRGGKPVEALGPPGPYVDPELSPDGRRVAVERTDPQSGAGDLWLLERGRDVAARFTFDPASDSYAIWSPNSQQIIFRSARSGVNDLYRKAASGVAAEEPLLQSPANKYPTAWSADGRYLVYGQAAAGGYDLWVLPLEPSYVKASEGIPSSAGTTAGPPARASAAVGKPFPFLQSNFNEDQAQFSPDARWLAYTSNESGRYEVYVQSFPQAGGKWQVSTGGGIAPRWRRDGRELYYIAPDAKLMAVALRGESTLEAGQPAALFQTNIYEAGGYASVDKQQYDVAADGQRFLINTPVEGGVSAPLTVVLNWTAGLKKQ
ncbi:MAG: serine/threonine-protein kinase [Acidobacteria bacterium]|nr:serine/threonine-protein kinase [Acidobacteriota bacterium]